MLAEVNYQLFTKIKKLMKMEMVNEVIMKKKMKPTLKQVIIFLNLAKSQKLNIPVLLLTIV
jgi:hypothetical protein